VRSHTKAGDGKRVLFLTSNYPRWAGDTTTPFVHQLAVDLLGHGWSVTVLAPHAPGAQRRESMDGVEIRRFRYLLPEAAQTVCYGGGALVNLRDAPANKLKLPALVAAEWAATARALAEGFAVVHSHWTLPQGFVASTMPRRKIPRILTVHGGDVFGLRGRTLDRFSARALRAADRVTVASTATEAAVQQIAGAGVRATRVPIGIDLDVEPRADLVAELQAKFRRQSGPLLVFVGRVVEEKGVLDLVEVVARLAREMPGVTAAIVGTGQHTHRVRDAAAAAGITDRIQLPGWADPADVPSWFAAADVVLAPSKVGVDGWTEGQGLAIVEAMAAARPVVATRTGGIPDTITDEVDGILVPPGDVGEMANAVRRIVGDERLAARLGNNAVRTARERFDRSVTAAAFDAIYREEIERATHE
jgi:phosphatidyl-myo-inositol dimannoside synthase